MQHAPENGQGPRETRPLGAPRPLSTVAPMEEVILQDPQKPILTFRLVFQSGSIDDPKGKEGITSLTARLLAEGGTRDLSSSELLNALFPMAAQLDVQSDKELTTFIGRVHQDNLERFLKIFGDVLLEPRFDPKEFERLRQDAINQIRNQLRGQDDEALAKIALDALHYEGQPYAHFDGGQVKALESITLDDVRDHWRKVFTQDRLIIGMAGNVAPKLEEALRSRLSNLPVTGAAPVAIPAPPDECGRVWIFEKPILSTAISMGYPYALRRGDPDFFRVALATSFIGEHRQTNGFLFGELREKRGLNYGDYAYAEHFEQEGWGTFPLTNIVRRQQDYSIWLRPVENQNAMFAARGALYFIEKLLREGLTQEQFEQTRGFLNGYTRLLEQTDSRRLGYAIDGLLYGTPDFLESYRTAMKSMTVDQVNAAIRTHLTPNQLSFVFVTKDAKELQKLLVEQPATPIQYPTPKAESVLEEDKKIEVFHLPVKPDRVEIREVDSFME
jgi:zinc protease